ncbi:response regulator [Aquimarina celericrescens]|uniref:histidine kinase n=1 Tax=Aquimarina celericrescens TaxID=1964542 RepID=A0ABW5AX39_9FLAO
MKELIKAIDNQTILDRKYYLIMLPQVILLCIHFAFFDKTDFLKILILLSIAIHFLYTVHLNIHKKFPLIKFLMLNTNGIISLAFFIMVFNNWAFCMLILLVILITLWGIIDVDKKNYKKIFEVDNLKKEFNARKQMLTNLSHKFRTPLTKISLVIQRKLNETSLSEKDKEEYELILKIIQQLANQAGEILEYSNYNGVLDIFENEINKIVIPEEEVSEEVKNLNPKKREKPLVLIVEDDQVIRKYLKVKFETLNYLVKTVENGKEGVKFAKKLIPDVIISDIMMPSSDIDGISLTILLKNDYATEDIPIILLSAKASSDDILEGTKMKADAYITKPPPLGVLEEKVSNLINIRWHFWAKYKDSCLKLTPAQFTSHDVKLIKRINSVLKEKLFNKEFGVKEFAFDLGISQKQLGREISRLYHKKPLEYIHFRRIEHASYLLTTYVKEFVGEIAELVGYENEETFRKYFKKFYNCSPSEYRKNN